MPNDALFSPLKVGKLTLSHRVVFAPVTRVRATEPGNTPNDMNAVYYGQRASQGGLIICEASQVLPGGRGVRFTPGCHSAEQIAGWKLVTRAIHDKGGFAYLQLWHMGRLSHESYQPDGRLPAAPSAVAAKGMCTTAQGERVPFQTPRALTLDEIAVTIQAYAQAARNAVEAGFDGVEIHSANGYLLEQFLQSRTNQRTDEYGGSIANRCRMSLDVTRAVAAAIGADRTGIRLSPFGVANDSGEDDPLPLYSHLIRELDTMGLAYLHLIEPRASGAGQGEVDRQGVPGGAETFRPMFRGPLITAGNFVGENAAQTVAAGHADAIAFGRYFTSNPDLPARIRAGAPLTPYHRPTFYSPGPKGYIDFPEMGAA